MMYIRCIVLIYDKRRGGVGKLRAFYISSRKTKNEEKMQGK